MKTCNRCSEQKNLSEFFNDKASSDGKYSICKACKRVSTYTWRETNKDKYNAYMRQKNKNNYPSYRLRRYGITLDQYTNMLKNQNGLCAICNKPPSGKRPLVVDHNHTTGSARQLLCYGCNRGLAILENKELLTKAEIYLKKHAA